MMKFPLFKTALLLSLAAPLGAQTVVDPSDRFLETAFNAEQIQFLYDSGASQQEQQAGMNVQTINGFGSGGYVYDFCADFFEGTDVASTTYTVNSGFGGLDSTRQDQVQALLSNALPVFNGMLADYIDLRGSWADPGTDPGDILLYQGAYDELLGYAGGMQIALWEIIHENAAEISIDDDGANPGFFFVDLGASGNTPAIRAGDYAEQFLANIRATNNPWTNQGGLDYHFADAPDGEQDRLWVTVPEPSSALLGAFGMLALLRRRRA